MSKCHRFLLLALALAFAPTLSSSPASATGADTAETKEARDLMNKGNTFFRKGDWPRAHAAYSAAWALKKHFSIAANLADVELRLGKHREAAEHLTYYLANLPPGRKERKAAEKKLLDAKSHISAVAVSVNVEEAEIFVDGKPVGGAPLASEILLDPGEHRFEARLKGYTTAADSIATIAGKTHSVALVLERENEAPAVGSGLGGSNGMGAVAGGASGDGKGRPVPTQSPSLVPVYVAGGVAAVGIAATIVFELSRSSQADDAAQLADRLGPGGCASGSPNAADCSKLHDANVATNRSADRRNVSLGVVGAAVVFGVGYLLWPRSAEKSNSTALTVVPVVAETRGGLSLSGSF